MHGAANTPPGSVLEREVFSDRAALVACLAGWKPAVDAVDDGTDLIGLVAKDRDEFGEPEVAYLPAPEPLHRLQVQILDEDAVEAARQLSRELEVVVAPLVGNAPVYPGEIQSGLVAVVAPPLLGGEAAVSQPDRLHTILEKQRGNLFAPVAEREESLQSKIHARAFTRHDAVVRLVLNFAGKEEIEVVLGVPLHGYGLNAAVDVAGLAEPKYGIPDTDTVSPEKRPTGLLEGKRAVLAALAEPRGRGYNPRLSVAEEKPVGAVDALGNILYDLTAQIVPMLKPGQLLELGQVLLQAIHVQTPAEHPVVSSTECNAVIPNARRSFDPPMQVPVFLATVELEDKCFSHAFILPRHLAPYIPALNGGTLRR